MAIFRYTAPDGNKYRVEAPDDATDQQVYALVLQNFPFADKTTQELKDAPSAPSKLKDVGLAAKQGLAGGIQSLTNLFGVDNAASQYLGGVQQSAFEGLSPARREEIARRQELIERSGGDIGSKVGSFLEAPLQTGVQALTGSIPIIAGSFIPGGQIAAGASLGARALAGARGAGGIGGLMGVGGQKGQDYEAVKQALLAQGESPEVAEQKAQEAAQFSLQNLPRQAVAGGAGALEGVFGIESILANAARKVSKGTGAPSLDAPTYKKAIGLSLFGEAIPEAVQAAVGQVGTNVALNQAGISKDLTEGLAGTVAHDALVGAVLGLAVSPLQMSNLQREQKQAQAAEQAKKQAEFDAELKALNEKAAAERAVLQKQTDEIQQRMGQTLALPAPAQILEPEEVTPPLKNPIGNLTPDELGPEVTQYINKYRKDNNLPLLQSYSIEDIKATMTAVNPEGEKAALDSILTAKTGYSGTETYTPENVIDAAVEKNVATDTKGFNDFLTRTTGVNNLEEMSQPQLYAAFKALKDLPANTTGEQIVLPTGSNSSSVPPAKTTLPAGYEIIEKQLKEGEAPEGFAITPEGRGKPLTTVINQAEIQAEIDRLTGPRQKEAAKALDEALKYEAAVLKSRDRLDEMVARGEAGTEAYAKAQARQKNIEKILDDRRNAMYDKVEEFSAPLQGKPFGKRNLARSGFTIVKDGKETATFPTRQAAEESILTELPDDVLESIVSSTKSGGFAQRAAAEQNRRTSPPKEGKKVSEVLRKIKEEKAKKLEPTPEAKAQMAEVEAKLKPILKQFGLGDVKLNLVDKLDAEGSYNNSLIEIALSEEKPVRVLRHESIHALKDLKFFSPEQWTALTRMAKDQWIDKYLKSKNAQYKGKKMSRYDAYVDLYKGDMEKVTEEAIADAFADFDSSKAPPGMLAALLKRLNDFFVALRNALNDAGFQTFEDVFGQIERGELKAGQAEGGAKRLSVKEYQKEQKQAKAYEKANGIMPYVSEPIDELPTDSPRFSLQSYNPDKHLSFDPTLGVPINKDGTVTVYYHTTKENALRIAQNRMIPSDGRALIFLTNESGGDSILKNRGNFDQDLDGSTVLVYVTPDQLQVDEEYDNGRRDFFIPLAEGDYFAKKMKLQSIQKSRKEPITDDFLYSDHEERISKAVNDYKAATTAERRKLVATARKLLKKEHNVGSLLTENGKLEKTRIGDYNISYDGNSVASQGLGLASAQKITDKVNTCPRSAICEGLCLGETSGGNFMFGGAAQEDVGTIEKSAFRAGARMMQYLKTEALIINPEAFATLLQGEIDSLVKWSASPTQVKVDPETKKRLNVEKELYSPAIRLNVTSDFQPSMFRGLIEANPDVMFYDYTKLGTEPIADNHHLTYSSTGFGQMVDGKKVFFKDKSGKYDHNWATMRKRLNNGQNVAMAFSSKSGLPKFLVDTETGAEFQVLDGDDYDARFLDEKSAVKEASGGKGVIVGLRNKAGNMSEKNATVKTEGFFVQYDPKTDGDTVVVPNQMLFKLAKAAPAKPADGERLSLRTLTPDSTQEDVVSMLPATPMFRGVRGANTSNPVGAQYFSSSEVFAKTYSPSGKVDEHRVALQNPLVVSDADWSQYANSPFNPIEDIEAKVREGGHDGVVNIRKTPMGSMVTVLALDSETATNPDKRMSLRSVPAEPGTEPIPSGMVRLYHQTDGQSLDKIAKEGLSIKYAKGIEGPKSIYAGEQPFYGAADSRPTVEFYVPKAQWDAPFVLQDVPPEQILAAHYPWHKTARYLESEPQSMQSALDGQFDDLKDDDTAKAVQYIKDKYGKTDERMSLREAPDTPEFKRFFAGSKVVDADGKPMVMYHGTRGDFTSFQPGLIFTSPTPMVANKFAANDMLYSPDKPGIEPGANVMPVYVRATNPFDYENPEHVDRLFKLIKDNYAYPSRPAAKRMLGEGQFKLIEENVDAIKELGFDGLFVEEFGEKNLAVFKSMQIKSATGNRGTYDVNSPDIRFSLREVDNFFNKIDDIKEPEGVEIIRENWIGSVSGLGDRDSAYDLYRVQGGKKYMDDVQNLVRDELGESFKGYRLMSVEELEEIKAGAMGSQLASFTLRPDIAHAFANLASYRKVPKDQLRVVEMDLTPEHVVMIGHPGERELVIDYGQGYNPDAVVEASVNARMSLRDSIDPDTLDRVNETTTAREEKGYIERITDALGGKSYSSFRKEALNRFDYLAKMDKERAKKMGGTAFLADQSAESAALSSDLAAGVTASVLGVHDRNGGIPVYKDGFTRAFNDNGKIKGPVAIFAPLAKYNDPFVYQLYQFWAGAQRGSRLLASGKEELFKPGDLAKAKQLQEQYPEFVEIQKEWTQFNNGLVDFLVDTGVLSKAQKAEFIKYSDYIPFYRQMDGEKTIGPNIFQSISGVKAPKKLKGGEAPLADFLETIVRNTQSSIQMGMKNVAAARAIKNALEIEQAEKLPPNAKVHLDTVQVLENGNLVSYQAYDMAFVEALKSLNMPDLPFIGLLSGPANLLRNLVTKDPGFMLANMVRDSMAAYVTSGVKMTPILDTFKNFGSALAGTSPEFQALLNAGILGGYEFSQNIEVSGRAFEAELKKKASGKSLLQRIANPSTAATSLWEALEKGTTASDAATRIEVYKRVLAETNNEAEALYRALEVMNFNRKGSSPVVRILTAAIPFLNARMQGLDVLYRASFGELANKDAKAIQRAFFVRGMTMAALSCMYWALTHDEEEYKKQEQETKDNNWLIPSLGIKIPTPFEIGVIFKIIPERIMALTFGDDTGKDFMKSMARQLSSTLAVNPIPQTALPFVEVATNYSFFTQRPIVGQGMEGIQPEYQVGPGTSQVSANIGSALGISPMKLDHLIGGFTGTMGMYMVSAIDAILNANSDAPAASKRFEQLPIIRRFAIDPEARGTVTAYYELKNATDSIVRTSNLLERTMNFEERGEFLRDNIKMLASKEYILDLEKTMKEFRQMQVMIRSSNMDADAKREALLRINQAQNALTSNIQTLKANLS